MARRLPFSILMLAFALPPHALADEPPPASLPSLLSLDQSIDLFRRHGFDLLIAEAAVMSAEGDVRVARGVFNPNVSYSYSHIFNYNPSATCPADATGAAPSDCSPDVHSIGLSDNAAIEDAIAGKRGLRIDVAERALKAARMSRLDAQRNLEFQVKQQYFQAVLAKRAYDFSRDVQKQVTEYLDLTQKRFKGGAISEADEARVEIDKLEADQAVDTAEQNLRQAKVGLAFLLGVRGPLPPFEIEPNRIDFALPPPLAGTDEKTLLNDALKARPDLQSQEAQRERALAAVALAKRQRFPDLSLSLGFAYAAPGGGSSSSNTTPPTLTVGVSGNVPVFYQQQGEIRKAEADLRTQEVTRAKLEALVASDVQTAFAAFSSTQKLVHRMEERLLERAQTALDKVLLQRAQGQASGLDVSAARRTYIATRLEYLQDLTNYWIAVSQLEQAVGRELRK